MILDLRFNGGGDELLARAIAGRFLAEAAVYSFSRYRNGPHHDDLGEPEARTVEPRGPWTYTKPLIILCGERTMSSAESFACMLAKVPGAVLVGDRTAGSSGNPRQLELPGKITVSLPRWLGLDHTGKPLDGSGVEPHVRIDLPAQRYGSADDPVVREALRLLRGR
jgi:C-terminal processing protease CtpA/Prc